MISISEGYFECKPNMVLMTSTSISEGYFESKPTCVSMASFSQGYFQSKAKVCFFGTSEVFVRYLLQRDILRAKPTFVSVSCAIS